MPTCLKNVRIGPWSEKKTDSRPPPPQPRPVRPGGVLLCRKLRVRQREVARHQIVLRRSLENVDSKLFRWSLRFDHYPDGSPAISISSWWVDLSGAPPYSMNSGVVPLGTRLTRRTQPSAPELMGGGSLVGRKTSRESCNNTDSWTAGMRTMRCGSR